ncbi:efflux transporter outer membrane subunit [Erwinia sp. SLM-02]|uniref:efflux transporter outer membrane subunit n=1 Tax=Erwinia sp. SLM-02 TaxID=3020057 RepID=UPI0028D7E0F6|nr:efflux transporter outer membrane subunit [uncultured Erwinia sp.]
MYRISVIALSMMLAGCLSLDPDYQRPAAPVPATWPGQNADGSAPAVLSNWQQVMGDSRLKAVVARALASNRDLRKAISDIEQAKALYGEERASLFPTLNAGLTSTRSRTTDAGVTGSAEASGSVSSFEIDLFGHNRSLSRAAKETWLASEFTAQNTRLTLIAETATAWITLAADNSNLQLAQETMASAGKTLEITQRRQAAGVADGTDMNEAMTVYQSARASVASYQTLVAQDRNALTLLAGESLPDSLLPGPLDKLTENAVALVPAGLSSSLLLRRPDVQEAEHSLKSANADIGAARANFFPSLSLTSSAGVASGSLSSLFSHGANVWSFAPSLSLPLFAGGANAAALKYAEAEKQGLIAAYEKAIQSGFKDVADALARRATLSEQMDAQREYVAAAQRSVDLSLHGYQAGSGDYLTVLTNQRTLWSAQLELIALQQTDYDNRITLWQSLGGGS